MELLTWYYFFVLRPLSRSFNSTSYKQIMSQNTMKISVPCKQLHLTLKTNDEAASLNLFKHCVLKLEMLLNIDKPLWTGFTL